MRPDVVFHLAIASQPTGIENEGWRVSVEWSARLAEAGAAAGAHFVFTSTAMVFSNDARGPFTIENSLTRARLSFVPQTDQASKGNGHSCEMVV